MARPISTTQPDQWAQAATCGSVMWGVWALAVRPEWSVVLLVLAPFVILPLGLGVATRADTGPAVATTHRLITAAPILANLTAASYIPQPGLLAIMLSIPWLAFTLLVAVVGAGRLVSRSTLADPGIGTDAGLVLLAVGGIWLTISRGSLNPLGFSDAIVHLTAVHFHYAGFALPIVAGSVAHRLHQSAALPLATTIGVLLTATGILVGGWLEPIAATLLAVAGIGTAGALLRLVARHRGGCRWPIGVAALALGCGMGLAVVSAWSPRAGWGYLDLHSMAALHGSLNALGFGVLGLIGLNLLPTTRPSDARALMIHLGRPSTEALHHLATSCAADPTTNPPGMLDRPTPPGFTRRQWRRSIEHADLAAARAAFSSWSGHQAAGIAAYPPRPPIAVGETLALAIPIGPISVSATCRIVDVIDEPDRYGFTYSTLPHHPEDGEESFIVTRRSDGSGDVSVTAVWRPATIAARICPPLTGAIQNRAITRYLDGVATACTQLDMSTSSS